MRISFKNRRDINKRVIYRKDSVARQMLKNHIILKNGFFERDYWQALEGDLLKQFTKEETSNIMNAGHIISCILLEPVETRKNRSYNKV